MENKWFKKADDLEESKSNDNGMSYFQRGGSLEEIVQTNSTFLKPAGDLEESKSNDNGMSYFQRGGSLEEPVQTNNSFLKPAGDLEESKSNDNGMSYFQRGGSLEEIVQTNSTFLKPAGDLESSKQNNSFKFEKKEETIKTPEEIKNWIKSIVSGKKKGVYGFGEGPQVTSSGRILVGLDELKQMVENGDNIISAEYFENINMVDIEFESFRVPNKSR